MEVEAPDAVANQPQRVEITHPEQPFGGVIITVPWEQNPIVVELGANGTQTEEGEETEDAVTSVHGRTGDVVGEPGDYSLDELSPPANNFTLPGKMRIKADGSLQLWNPDQSKWHTLSVGGTAGGEYILIGAGET